MIEVLKQARDFIERTSSFVPISFDNEGMGIHAMLSQTIAELEKQKSVAWIKRNEYNEYHLEPIEDFDINILPINVNVPLYTSPQSRKPHPDEFVLCTHDPLTHQQITEILNDGNVAEMHQGNWLVLPYSFARAIEEKLGIGDKS
jgi:hypothetical protein